MAESVSTWASSLPWGPHQKGLAQWAAARWGWHPEEADWPSALALVAAAEDEGHTALDWARAPEVWARRFASVPAPEFSLPNPDRWPRALFDDGWLVRRGDLVQTARNAGLQATLFDRLTALAAGGPPTPGASQDDAVARAGKTRFLVLAGGPGTGKTTTLKNLVAAWQNRAPGLRTVVAAPTGRAAARARQSFSSETGGPDCLTLHQLLGLRPGLGRPWHGPHRPLPFDLVIVDEASMVDLRTAVALVEALAPGAALVLVGDPGQLPSVEAGSVLADVLGARELAGAVVRLIQRFRLAESSRSLARVFDLLQGEVSDPGAVADELAGLGRPGSDFSWVPAGDPRHALEAWGTPRGLTVETLGERLLLTPVHGGPVGTVALGHALDRQLGRPPGTVDHGTPWMITRNLRHLGLSNGDRGLVIREGGLWFVTPDHDRRFPFSLVAEDGVAAWAVTVHKSQGSEADRVVLVLPEGSTQGLVRELVYTGLTRAKKSAVLVATRDAVVRALGASADRTSGFGLRD